MKTFPINALLTASYRPSASLQHFGGYVSKGTGSNQNVGGIHSWAWLLKPPEGIVNPNFALGTWQWYILIQGGHLFPYYTVRYSNRSSILYCTLLHISLAIIEAFEGTRINTFRSWHWAIIYFDQRGSFEPIL